MKSMGIAMGALVCAVAAPSFAQSAAARDAGDVLSAPVRAPEKAFELGVSAGYTQGLGGGTPDRRVNAGPGGSIGASLGYRINPHWSVGAAGAYQGYGAGGTPERSSTLRGATADVHGTYHLAPYNRLDPHVSFGAGYRLFAESPAGDAPTTLSHSVELGKIAIGLDVRTSESVAISPVIGADLDLFVLRAGGVGPAASGNPSLSAFVFAGVEGRFDVGGTRVNKPTR